MMIDFKGLQQCNACMERIQAAGHSISYVDNQIQVSDVAAVQSIIDTFTLADACAPIIADIKALANQKILAFMPVWKQANRNARINELNTIRFDRAWTDAEIAEMAVLQSAGRKIDEIRDASNAHEARLLALESFDSILAYDISTGWPP